MARAREALKPRLMLRISKVGNCWEWTGSKDRDGYGVLTIGRKQFRANRVSFSEFKGSPDGMLVCHRCDNRSCINPDHLFLGSALENTQDMINKGRKNIVRGDRHPLTKILPAERTRIRTMRQDGASLKAIAAQYGVSFQLISDICNRRRNYASGN